MRIFWGVLLLVLTTGLVYILDHPIGALPAIGRLIDPVNGCWANAEPVNENFNASYKLPGMQQQAAIWIDGQLIPHIHAANDHDLYYLEGYIHARFRLWQMDMETRAAAGRVSEVIGEKGLNFDRKQRRKGMVYAAENSLQAMEADPRTKLMTNAYTDGVNAYISSLHYKDYPLEYKLMGFAPEPYTNLKISLLLKYMADDLTGGTNDMALTYLRDALPPAEFALLYPEKIAGSTPVIPGGTPFDKPSLTIPVAPPDSIVFPRFSASDFGDKREEGKGSNNWAVSGSRTASGAAILCNDPHLGLNLPSLWYVAQLQAPGVNVYGVSLPGTPGVIIGFNDSLAWGFTNNYRDVKDFYLIKPVAGNKNKYWFGGRQLDFSKRIERIAVKGRPDIIDTLDYTLHGPVMYDDQYISRDGLRKTLAVCWMAHRPTNEMLSVYLLNKAGNYNGFVDAILNFQCPAQNMAYADRAGNIAIWGQGQFVNKWKEQGKYVMDGSDSATLWKELIPMRENPHVFNPPQGYVTSANQSVTDSTYPYWYDGDFVELRAWRLNQLLGGMQKATIPDMFAVQQDVYSILAANTLPVMLKYLPLNLSPAENSLVGQLKNWNYRLEAGSDTATLYQVWWYFFYKDAWAKKFARVPDGFWPLPERTMQLLSAVGDSLTSNNAIPVANLRNDMIQAIPRSFKEMVDSVNKYPKDAAGKMAWYQVKNTTVSHLTKLPAFSYDHLDIGGWGNTVNAAKKDHGPSWRMVVQMGREIEAYGIYPGGQSGNPGSKYYADFLPDWAAGKYIRLQFLPNADKQTNDNIKYTWTVHP
jgi:penicillin amidase